MNQIALETCPVLLYREIPLNNNLSAIVDVEDYECLIKWKWRAKKKKNTYYAYRQSYRKGGGSRIVLMHRLILNAVEGVEVDHENGNGLDNRRLNLRIATTAENQHNQTVLRSDNTIGFKGVFKDKRRNKYHGQLQVGEKHLTFGSFDTPQEAADLYDEMAIKYFGEFACTNAKMRKIREEKGAK
jgi:hypothetical protein